MSMSFVIATNDQEEVKKAVESIRTIRGQEDQIVLIENSKSMAHAYNEGVRRATNERICFTHQDVRLRDSKYWTDEMLDDLYGQYNVGFLGAAGSKDIFPDARWYKDGNRMCGAVIHAQYYNPGQPNIPQAAKHLPDGRLYAEWLTQYGDFGRCVVIDGVVLISTKTVLKDIGGFDETAYGNSWHYYDLDTTLRAHLRGYHNIVVPLFVCHMSLGSYDDEWSKTREKFSEKWRSRNEWRGVDVNFPVQIEHAEDYTVEHLRNLRVVNT